jgi:hypothetical protein
MLEGQVSKADRRAYRITAQIVLKCFDRMPRATSTKIAQILDMHPAYVRKTLYRNGRFLFRGRRKRPR